MFSATTLQFCKVVETFRFKLAKVTVKVQADSVIYKIRIFKSLDILEERVSAEAAVSVHEYKISLKITVLPTNLAYVFALHD